jgi:hypothetical protein
VGELKLEFDSSMLKDGWRKWLEVAGIYGGAAGRDSVGEERKGLACGSHMSVTEEEKRRGCGIRKPERKAPFSRIIETVHHHPLGNAIGAHVVPTERPIVG